MRWRTDEGTSVFGERIVDWTKGRQRCTSMAHAGKHRAARPMAKLWWLFHAVDCWEILMISMGMAVCRTKDEVVLRRDRYFVFDRFDWAYEIVGSWPESLFFKKPSLLFDSSSESLTYVIDSFSRVLDNSTQKWWSEQSLEEWPQPEEPNRNR